MPPAVHASWQTLVSYDPVQLWSTAGFSARPTAVHCLCFRCWRADRVIRRVIPPVRRRHIAPRQHGQHQCHAGHRQARPMLGRSSPLLHAERPTAQR